MHIQQLLAEAQAKADSNNDGKLSLDDLKTLADEHGLDGSFLDSLKAKADTNNDGRLSVDDISTAVAGASKRASNTAEDAKEHVGNFAEDAEHHIGNMVDTVKEKLFGDKQK